MANLRQPSRAPTVLSYVLCYVLFFVLLAASYVGFILWQPTSLRLIAAALGEGSFAVQFVQDVSVLFMGFALFGLVMAGEPYLRHGVERGELLRRFLRLALILVGLVVVETVLQELLIHLHA